MKNIREHYTLSLENIDRCILQISSLKEDNLIDEETLLRLRLSFEEVLLNLRDHFGEEKQITFSVFVLFHRIHINIVAPGPYYNPLDVYEDETSAFSEMGLHILEKIGLRLIFSHKNGVNRIGTTIRRSHRKNFLTAILIAIGLGLVCGFGGTFLPDGFRENANLLLTPIYNTIIGLITMVSIPLIFLYTINGIGACGDIQTFSHSGKRILGGLFGTMFLLLVLSITAALLVFSPSMAFSADEGSLFAILIDTVFSLFPQNIIQPFVDGNSTQIIFLGLFIGCVLLILGQKTDMVAQFLRQLSDVLSLLLEWFCMLIPVMLFVLITQTTWANAMGDVLNAWPLLLLMAALILITFLATVLLVRSRIKIDGVLKYLVPVTITALSTGSTMSTYKKMQDALQKGFPIDPRKVDFSLPMAVTFYAVNATLEYSCVSVYCTAISGIDISPGWILRAGVLCFLFSFASPPVSGGAIVAITMIFDALGIPSSCLVVAVPLVTLAEYPITAYRANMTVLILAWLNQDKPSAKKTL